MQIVLEKFPDNQYVKQITRKSQIVIHHTVSGPGISGDKAWWESTPERIATHFIIDRDGVIHQFFKEEYWASHLGIKQEVFNKFGVKYQNLDQTSISIELDSWGPLKGDLTPVGNPKFGEVKYPYEYCTAAPFRGYRFYERYTTKQLEALQELLLYLTKKHLITRRYNENMFDQNRVAISGAPGIWGHVSFRSDKSDPHPQKELVDLLKNLSNVK